MTKLVVSILSGILFGWGLALSQMINPEVVQGFLDIFGDWRADLMFVMIGALSITVPGFYWLLKKRQCALSQEPIDLPKSNAVDKRLLSGAVLFGIGWGLAGYCPGPAVGSLALGLTEPLIFVIAMIVGFWLADQFNKISN